MNFGEHNKVILQYAAMLTVDGLLKSYNNTENKEYMGSSDLSAVKCN